jgi:hypothetical protein
MKLRFVTDIHAIDPLAEPFNKRAGRMPHMGIPILCKDILSTLKRDGIDRIVNGGDVIQVQADQLPQVDIDMLARIRDEFNKSGLPVHHILGNHDIERTGGIKGAAEILGIHPGHSFVDTPDGHRLIFLQEEFKDDPRGTVLYPWSDHAMAFLKDKLASAPTQSVTVFAHTPCDDFDWQEMSTAMRGLDFRNSFRENSWLLRKVMEESGKNILFVAGHTHIGMEYSYRNVRYLTLRSPVEKISEDNPIPSRCFADIERIGDDQINVTMHGHGRAPHKFSWSFPPLSLLAV